MAVFLSGSDESSGKTHRDTFFFCGWVAPEEDWSRFFAPAWQERVLDGPPKIPYLHMTDIRSRQWRDEQGLSTLQADDRVDEAIALIHTMPSLYPVGISVDGGQVRDDFADTKVVLTSTGGAKQFEPDYLCFLAYAWMALTYVAREHPEAEKLDFVVEIKSTVTRYIQEFHANLKDALTALGRPHLALLVGDLIPGDKERVPLQAADVLCWFTARATQPETMDSADKRRYLTIARRKSWRAEIDRKTISKIASAAGQPSRFESTPSSLQVVRSPKRPITKRS